MTVGICGYLVKGISTPELITLIFSLAKGGAYLPPVIQEEIMTAFQAFNAGVGRGLSPREREIMAFLPQGKSDKEISAELKISEATVRTHIRDLFRKLGVHSRKEAISAFLGLP